MRVTLGLLLLVLVVPAGAAGQDRSGGLPPRVKWTVNFDAGWGTFGFANSLYDNPKEPGVEENLSDQWFEGYVKPALVGQPRVRLNERALR